MHFFCDLAVTPLVIVNTGVGGRGSDLSLSGEQPLVEALEHEGLEDENAQRRLEVVDRRLQLVVRQLFDVDGAAEAAEAAAAGIGTSPGNGGSASEAAEEAEGAAARKLLLARLLRHVLRFGSRNDDANDQVSEWNGRGRATEWRDVV